jgi:5-methylcytosine-specific restriction endonuclease McrA
MAATTSHKELSDGYFDEASRSNPTLMKHPTLLLNADYRPVSYYPLSTVPWAKVIWWIGKGEQTGIPRITVLENYPDLVIRSGRKEYPLPSVVAYTKYITPPEKVPFTRFNVLLRDDFTCQYSGENHPVKELTWDHVLPRSRGGKTSWTNIVTCYSKINEMKDDRTPEEVGLQLIKKPKEPTFHEIYEKGRKYPPKYLHETWRDYLYWDTVLDE